MKNEIIIGFIFLLIGLIPTYYFYVKSIRNKEPVYSIKSNNLITNSVTTLENLNILYRDRKIDNNLTVSKILFYNKGAETITKDDINTSNHLQILVRFYDADRFDLLDVSIMQTNCEANQFTITLDREKDYQAVIDFDYLDKNQGAVIQVIHTGTSADDIEIVGNIKGVQKIIQVTPDELLNTTISTPQDKNVMAIIIGFSVMFLILYFTNWLHDWSSSANKLVSIIGVAFTLLGGMTTIVLIMVLINNLLGFIRSLFGSVYEIPLGLGKFLE